MDEESIRCDLVEMALDCFALRTDDDRSMFRGEMIECCENVSNEGATCDLVKDLRLG
jgi:hypothetical protein